MAEGRIGRIAPGIVLRLRIVFAAVSIALICVTLVTFVQMKYLKSSIDNLTVKSVSTFVIAEETERGLKRLLLLLQRVDKVSDVNELLALGDLAEIELSTLLLKSTDTLGTKNSRITAAELNETLAEITLGTREIFKLRRAVLEREARIKGLTITLKASGDLAATYFEDMSYAADSVAQRMIGNAQHVSPAQLEAFVQDYHDSLVLVNTVTITSLELNAVIDGASRFQAFSTSQDMIIHYNGLRQKTRNISILTGQLPDNQTREDLARLVLEMRGTLFGNGGIALEVAQLRDLREAFNAEMKLQHGPIENLSNVSAQRLLAARAEIDVSRSDLEQVTQQVITILVAVMLMTLIAIGATVIWVVERQINKRMAGLTKAVLAIADGQTSYAVDVTGPDEMGKMADALEVFKTTAEELHRSNAELEKFAYVAAHDLRSPLRAIQDLSTWLVEDTDNVFSGEGQQYMTLMTGRIERLNQLLTDLLEYSRAGSAGVELSKVSISEIVRESSEMLDPMGHFDIGFVGDCDSVITYASPIRQIFLNLINNAIKHHDLKVGKITVHAQVVGDRMTCRVQDNGSGIDPKYHGKIFGLFQTLKPRDEVEASGLGLAIIHKILERLGGKISVESDPSIKRGATFVFDIPISVASVEHIKQAA